MPIDDVLTDEEKLVILSRGDLYIEEDEEFLVLPPSKTSTPEQSSEKEK